MKKYLKFASLSFATIFGLHTPVFAQNANPVGMRYAGTQQYMGQSTTFVNPYQKTQYVAPQINSIYAQPMNRVSEIPLYGKNKSTYFYGQKKKDESPFADSGLYIFASYSTGETDKGVNLEHGEVDSGEADANDSMGTANGFTLGVGRVMSNTLSVEFMYSNYSGMKFGNWAKFKTTEETEPEEAGEKPEEIEVIDDSTYEVTSGGDIQSNFIGLGFKYNLENMFGTILGRLKPYIGFQLGIAQNAIDDYTVIDEDGYVDGDVEIPDENDEEAMGELEPLTVYDIDEYSNGELNFIGSSNRSFAVGAEIGFSIELEGNLSIDVFYKMNNYGKVKTSGNMVSTYDVDSSSFYVMNYEDEDAEAGFNPCTEVDGIPYYGSYTPDPYSSGPTPVLCRSEPESEEGVQSFTERRVSSGDMIFKQYGIKLKYMF